MKRVKGWLKYTQGPANPFYGDTPLPDLIPRPATDYSICPACGEKMTMRHDPKYNNDYWRCPNKDGGRSILRGRKAYE